MIGIKEAILYLKKKEKKRKKKKMHISDKYYTTNLTKVCELSFGKINF